MRDDIKLPKDSAAIVTSESLLGGKYLSLQPGGDETMLQPGQTITITQSSVSIEELLGKFIFSMTSAPKPGQTSGSAPAAAQPGAAEAVIPAAPAVWPQPDGAPVSCREKLRMLAENHAELAQALQDAFEDAVLMGVDEEAMRRILTGMVEGLESPKRAGR